MRNILTQVTVSLGGDKMDFKIEELEECYVVYMRYTGNHGNEETFEMMRRFKKWIKENHYWSYVEKYGVLRVALDDPQTCYTKHCRYDVMLRIAVSKFFRDLNNILDKTQLHMVNHPIIERYKEGEGINNFCDMLIPIE